MILQNSTDIKTEIFYNQEGDIAPIDVKYEKHTINPNGLIQLQNIPSLHTVFTIKGKEGVTITTYNKAEVIANQYDFTVDYVNGILTFHNSQIGKEIQVSYTNAIGRLSISADRIFTNLDQQGNVVQTLNTLIEEGQSVLSKLDAVGGATKIIDEMRGYIDSIKSLRPQITEGSNTSLELKRDINSAKLEKANLINEIDKATDKIDEMNIWVETNGDIVDLNNRVVATEEELNTVNIQLDEKADVSDVEQKINIVNELLNEKANKTELDNLNSTKADKLDLDEISKIVNKVVYIDKRGADNTGVRDTSDLLNSLIVELNGNGGGVIQFGNGFYRLDKQIVMLPNVILIGNQKWRGLGRQGYTVLQCYNRTDVQFLLKQNIRIENFWIEYPEQVDSTSTTPIEYNWTFCGADNNINDDIQLNNIFLKNSYKGIKANNFGRCNFSHIYGQPIQTGIEFSGIRDLCHVERIEFWTFNYTVGSNMYKWINTNGTAFDIKSIDGCLFSNLFAYGYKNGFYLDGEVWGTFVGCSADKCERPIYINKCNITQFLGGAFIGSNFKYPIITINQIMDTLSITDTSFFGNVFTAIVNNSSTGKLKIGANFKNVDNRINVPIINNGSCPTFVYTNEERLKVYGGSNTFVNGTKIVSTQLGVDINISYSDMSLVGSTYVSQITNGVKLDLGQIVSGERNVGFNVNLPNKGITAGLYVLSFDYLTRFTTDKKRITITSQNGATTYNSILWNIPSAEEKVTVKIPFYLGKSDSGTVFNILFTSYNETSITGDYVELTNIKFNKMSNATMSTMDYLYNNTFNLNDKPNYTLI